MLGRRRNRKDPNQLDSPSSQDHPANFILSSSSALPHHQQQQQQPSSPASPPFPSSGSLPQSSEKSTLGGYLFSKKTWFGGGPSSSSRERTQSNTSLYGAGAGGGDSPFASSGSISARKASAKQAQAQAAGRKGSNTSITSGDISGPLPSPLPFSTSFPSTSSVSVASPPTSSSNNTNAAFLSPSKAPSAGSRGFFSRRPAVSGPTAPPDRLLSPEAPVPSLPAHLNRGQSSPNTTTSHISASQSTNNLSSIPPSSYQLTAAGSPTKRSTSRPAHHGRTKSGGERLGGSIGGKKSWSRSMDDLSKLLMPSSTEQKAKIEAYRQGKAGTTRLSNEDQISPTSSYSTDSLLDPAVPFPSKTSPSSSQGSPKRAPTTNLTSSLTSNVTHSAPSGRVPHKILTDIVNTSSPTSLSASGRPSPSSSSSAEWGALGSEEDQVARKGGMLSPLGGEGSSSGGRTGGNPNRHSRMLSSGMLLVGGKGKEREKVKITRERERLDTNASSSSSTAGGGAATGGHVFRLPFSSSASQPSRMSTSASLSFSSAQSSSSSNPSNPYRPSPTSAMRPKSPLHTASSLSPSTPPFPRAESSSSRRTSQIVLQSGLLLKHEPPSTGFGRSSKSERENLGRHWKPYRVELKGSKLYFFKAPADRKAAIEAGFPTTMLPALDSAPEIQRRGTDDSIRTVASTNNRRAPRAYWGIGRHPELDLFPSPSQDDDLDLDADPSSYSCAKPFFPDQIRSATPEALMHELVFASQSSPLPTSDRSQESPLVDSILFSSLEFSSPLKIVADLAKAIDRAAAAVSDPPLPEDLKLLRGVRSRVRGVVERFCRGCAGSWWNRSEGGEVKTELSRVVKQLWRNGRRGSAASDPTRGGDEESTVREELLELIEKPGLTFGPPTNWTSKLLKGTKAEGGPAELRNLLSTGLTPDLFLHVQPLDFARSVHVFHVDIFSSLFSISSSPPLVSPILFIDAAKAFPFDTGPAPPLAFFSFSPDRPHFLTQVALQHIFSTPRHFASLAPSSSSSSPLTGSSNPSGGEQPSLNQMRGRILSHWINVGEHLRLGGDAAGFMAVAMALCSRAVARLSGTWRRISASERDLVKDCWVPSLAHCRLQDEENQHLVPFSLPRVVEHASPLQPIPFLGSVIEDVRRARRTDHPSLAMVEQSSSSVPFEPIREAWSSVAAAMEFVEAFRLPERSEEEPEDVVLELLSLFQKLAANPTSKHPDTRQSLPASMKAEPKLRGNLTESCRHSASSLDPHLTILPLLFAEPLPTLTLIDRSTLLEASRDQLSVKPIPYNGLTSYARPTNPPSPLSTSTPSSRDIIGLNAGGRQPFRPRSASTVAHARTASLDLAAPSPPPSLFLDSTLATSDNSKRKLFFGSLKEVGGIGETVLDLCGGQLILKVVREAPVVSRAGRTSRPSSLIESVALSRAGSTRAGSTREGIALSSKRNSMGFNRNSFIQSSTQSHHRVSVAGSERSVEVLAPLRVSVKAGSQEMLLDVAVYGVEGLRMAVKDDAGLGSKAGRRLTVDLVEYRSIFFATFRSFTTPLAVFEHLKARYFSTVSAVKDLYHYPASTLHAFPSWPLDGVVPTSVIDWPTVVRLRLSILSTLEFWFVFGGGQQDVLDDPTLFSFFSSFLSTSLPPSKRSSDSEQADPRSLDKIRRGVLSLTQTFVSSLLRPDIHAASSSSDPSPSEPTSRSLSPSVISPGAAPVVSQLDQAKPEDLVDDLDSIASTVLSKVTQEDLFTASENFELQCCDQAGWLPVSTRTSSQLEEEVVIQDFMALIQLPLTSAHGKAGDSTIAKKLPMQIRYAQRAQSIIRNWLISQISEPKIGAKKRLQRFEVLLAALDLCRSRSASDGDANWVSTESRPSSPASIDVQPVITSFVTSAIVAALISPESRLFVHTWQQIATSRGLQSVDSLAQLISKAKPVENLSEGCSASLGWVLERLVEIVCVVPNVFESNGLELVNFDKRRYLWNLINNSSALVSPPRGGRDEKGRISLLERTSPTYDLPSLQSVVSQELQSLRLSSHPPKRPFAPLVRSQLEKQKRDRLLREKATQVRKRHSLRPGDSLDLAGKPVPPLAAIPRKPHKGTRVGSLLRGLRPHSVAAHFATESSLPSAQFETVKTLEELDFVSYGKPSNVVSIVDSKVAVLINTPRSYVFKLACDDGAKHTLQAPTKQLLDKWMQTVADVSRSSSARRRTMVLSDGKLSPLTEAKNPLEAEVLPPYGPHPVFGVSLEELLLRDPTPTSIPPVFERLVSEIEVRGIEEVGIYRIPGTGSHVKSLQQAIDLSTPNDPFAFPDLSSIDIHVLCGALKSWLRRLPEAFIPFSLYPSFLLVGRMGEDEFEQKVAVIKHLLGELSEARFACLQRILEHASRVTEFEAENSMSAKALAIVFAPSLIRPDGNYLNWDNIGPVTVATRMMIENYHTFFPTDPAPEFEEQLFEEHETLADEGEQEELVNP